MHLLIVIPRQDRATGNWVTAMRLQHGMATRGHTVTIVETDGDSDRLGSAVAAAKPDLALLLHAWRSGRPWLATASTLPFAVLLTGTDVNAGMRDPKQAPVIATVLQRAALILSQNQLTVAALRRDDPGLAGKLHYLPPGITLGQEPFPLRQKLAATPQDLVLLCPAGIRPVKGVLELVDFCAPLINAGCPLRLALCGPILDDKYGQRLREAVATHPWATYLGAISPLAMPAAMRQADVIVSNSSSEGLPNALVEAAALGRPILARNIPGNRAVVRDGANGLFYHDAASFGAAIRRLLDEPELRKTLSRPEPERFSPEHEATVLETLCAAMLNSPRRDAHLRPVLR